MPKKEHLSLCRCELEWWCDFELHHVLEVPTSLVFAYLVKELIYGRKPGL